jgi:hypothetical protein
LFDIALWSTSTLSLSMSRCALFMVPSMRDGWLRGHDKRRQVLCRGGSDRKKNKFRQQEKGRSTKCLAIAQRQSRICPINPLFLIGYFRRIKCSVSGWPLSVDTKAGRLALQQKGMGIAYAIATPEYDMNSVSTSSVEKTKTRAPCSADAAPASISSGRKCGQRRRRRQKKRERIDANSVVNNAASVCESLDLLDLPDEILVIIIRWTLPRESADVARAIASLRSCCVRFNALCRMPSLEVANVDPRLAPFARCASDEYDPIVILGDGRLIRATGLARAPRLRRQFTQACVRYAIYSLIVTKPGTFVSNEGLDLVSFSSFARQRPPFPLLIHALTRGAYAPDHIEVCEYDDGRTDVCSEQKGARMIHKTRAVSLGERTKRIINGALAEAAAYAIGYTNGLPRECAIVANSVDLFEAYPDVAGSLCSTGASFSCWANDTCRLIRQATLDISSIVYPDHWDAIRYHARRSRKPLTDFSFLGK